MDPTSITAPSLTRYTEDLHNLFPVNSQILQVVFRKENMTAEPRYPYIKPRLLKYPLSLINHILPNKVFQKNINNFTKGNDIVHITSQLTDPVYSGSNVVVTVHDLIPFKKFQDSKDFQLINRLARINTKFYIKHHYEIVTVSNYVKKDIIQNFNIDEDSIHVIYPYVSGGFYSLPDKYHLRRYLGLPSESKLILSVGANTKRKNLIMVEKVMNKLEKEFRLVRVGSSINNSITFHNIDQETLNKIYNACDLLYFPSIEEGFGYPVPEAFKTGLPVVSSNIDAIKETAGDAALLVDPNDLEQNIEAIYKACENSSYYATKGYERANLFSSEKAFKKLQNLYDYLIT